jgi:hypothetical protein
MYESYTLVALSKGAATEMMARPMRLVDKAFFRLSNVVRQRIPLLRYRFAGK